MVELSLSQRLAVLERIDANVPYTVIATEFKCSKGLITRVKKNRASYEDQAVANADPDAKRPCRLSGQALDLDQRVYLWLCKARATKVVPVSGPMIKVVALKCAKAIGLSAFRASNGWLDGFRKRHDIDFKSMCGEGAVVDLAVVQDWVHSIDSIISGYALNDIFNCDETGLFWRGLPTKTMALRAEECKGGKKAKERVSVLLTASAAGEKMPLLVIHKSYMPRPFKKQIPLGIQWYANGKAWMNGSIFSSYMLWLNTRMAAQDRKILLLMDNAPCHIFPEDKMTHVKVVWLPANTTCSTQPLDAGIIKNFKVKYRHYLLNYIVSQVDSIDVMPKDFLKKVDIKMAVDWMKLAWADVKTTTIVNCFGHCNIKAALASDEAMEENLLVLADMVADAEQVTSLVELLGGDPNEVVLDEDVAAFESSPLDWEDDILIPAPVDTFAEAEESDDDEEDYEAPPPSIKEAAAALNVLAEWNRRHDIGANASIAQLVDAIARARSMAPNGSLDTWFV